jgi:hypothetical protein
LSRPEWGGFLLSSFGAFPFQLRKEQNWRQPGILSVAARAPEYQKSECDSNSVFPLPYFKNKHTRVAEQSLMATPRKCPVCARLERVSIAHPHRSSGKRLSARHRVLRRWRFGANGRRLPGDGCCISLAAAFHRGLVIYALNLVLVTENCRLADRWRCFVRQFIIWSPILAALVPDDLILQDVFQAELFALATLACGVSWAIVRPEHALAERLSGTFLVAE